MQPQDKTQLCYYYDDHWWTYDDEWCIVHSMDERRPGGENYDCVVVKHELVKGSSSRSKSADGKKEKVKTKPKNPDLQTLKEFAEKMKGQTLKPAAVLYDAKGNAMSCKSLGHVNHPMNMGL